VGRDVLSLIGLVAVMLLQDPYMALLGFAVAPPAMLVLRKLVKRIKGLAHTQFTGTADIMETMQESLQGIRTVKAFTLETDDARTHRCQHHGGRTQRQQDGAGLQPCEPADGNARRVGGRGRADVWRLQRGCLGATPGQFFSFLTAFLLAYEPAKRLARLNIELNSSLIGARKLLEIVDSPPASPATTTSRP